MPWVWVAPALSAGSSSWLVYHLLYVDLVDIADPGDLSLPVWPVQTEYPATDGSLSGCIMLANPIMRSSRLTPETGTGRAWSIWEICRKGNGGKTLIILVDRPLLQTAMFLLSVSVDAEGGTDWEVHGSRGARWYDVISHAYRYQISLLIGPLPSL